MATVLEEHTTEEQRSIVLFLGGGAKGLNAKDIHKEMFAGGSVCRVKRITTGSRNSLKDVRKSRMMPDKVALLRLRQKQLWSGGRVNSS
jgi:hypothetical protein